VFESSEFHDLTVILLFRHRDASR